MISKQNQNLQKWGIWWKIQRNYEKETEINQILVTETVLYMCLESCACLSQETYLFAFYSLVIFTIKKCKIWICACISSDAPLVQIPDVNGGSPADTSQLNVRSNMSPDGSREEAAFHHLATNAHSCLVMASRCRSRCGGGTLCASAQALSVNPFISSMMVRLLQRSRQEFSGILTGLSTYRHSRGVR